MNIPGKTLTVHLVTAAIFFAIRIEPAFSFDQIQFLHQGCYKDVIGQPDLPYQSPIRNASKNISSCVNECAKKYFMFAGLQNAEFCFCGNKFGRYGPSDKCRKPCSTSDQFEVCGGFEASNIYSTDVKVPGPPDNLKLIKATETSLKIKWFRPKYAPTKGFITDYVIHVDVVDSFDISHNNRTFNTRIIQVSESSGMTVVLGLRPASKYQVSVRAKSKNGVGPPVQALFWTEIGVPEKPEPPMLIQHHHGDHQGEIHVQLKGLRRNRYGPISNYQVLVIDETNPAPFVKDQMFDYGKAKSLNLNYWIAAEFPEDFFGRDSQIVEFIVGDNRTYGEYLNYGPLQEGRDYHVTLGVISTLNKVSKVSYAEVTHDQHALENVVVFDFHEHNHDHEHDHDHLDQRHESEHGNSDILSYVLTIIIAIMGVLMAIGLAIYGYLRLTAYRQKQKNRSRGDIQELTTHISSIDVALDNESVENQVSKMDSIRSRVWNIPVNFLELSHEVIGRGRFGSLVKGTVNRYGRLEPVNVQVIPSRILDDTEVENLAKDLDSVIKFGTHSNLISFIGICEDKDTIFSVFEQAWPSLKQALLDSRLDFKTAKIERKISTLPESAILNMMLDVTQGLEHLAKYGIVHKKLCAQNIFLSHNHQAKIGAIGIIDYTNDDTETDMTRWTAPEAYKSGKNYVWKCDIWSLAVVYWECITLGATPYHEVPNQEVPFQVIRGMRLRQPNYISEDLYQLLLTCWQVDLDERPSFEELMEYLKNAQFQQNQSNRSNQIMTINFHCPSNIDFMHEPYKKDLEIVL